MSDLRTAAQQALEAMLNFPDDISDVMFESITALKAALAQRAEPVQEPVAWRFKPMIGSPWSLSDDGYYISCKRDKGYIVEPLYATPPQRKPLTEEEIEAAAKSVPAAVYELMHGHEITVKKFRAALAEFSRAVERAHGIKE